MKKPFLIFCFLLSLQFLSVKPIKAADIYLEYTDINHPYFHTYTVLFYNINTSDAYYFTASGFNSHTFLGTIPDGSYTIDIWTDPPAQYNPPNKTFVLSWMDPSNWRWTEKSGAGAYFGLNDLTGDMGIEISGNM